MRRRFRRSAGWGVKGAVLMLAASAVLASAQVVQKNDVRLSISGKLSPRKLPRKGTAPISVAVGWATSTADGSAPPELRSLQIEINRHGFFDYAGLPNCPYSKIQPASTQRALAGCRQSLVGRGTFNAEVALRGQGKSYESAGELLLFRGEKKGRAVLYGQIYSAHPFATSFVIPFAVRTKRSGPYGTVLAATLPRALRSWGNLTAIEMKLGRRYSYRGRRHSFISAGCPTPRGFSRASFHLARASFAFIGGMRLSSIVAGSCRVRGRAARAAGP